MSKSTPGPWVVNEFRDKFEIFEGKINGPIVASTDGWGGKYAKEEQANAHLISAAPEMLEVLEWLQLHPQDAEALMGNINAAIKKA